MPSANIQSSEKMSLESQIEKWIKEEGYPLEMRVKKKFSDKTDFDLRHSWYYQDPESDTSREIDIVCTATDAYGLSELNFVLECKGTSKPWVLFTSEDAVDGYNRLLAFSLLSKGAYPPLATLLLEETEKAKIYHGFLSLIVLGIACPKHLKETVMHPIKEYFLQLKLQSGCKKIVFGKIPNSENLQFVSP